MRVLLFTILFLVLVQGVPASARMSEDITSVVRAHKVFADRFIAAMELQHESINLLAEVIFWENWYTDPDKRAAYLTGAVVMNRLNSDEKWMHPNGKTVKSVLYAPGQYSTTKYFFTKEIPQECYDMARDIYLHGTPDVPAGVIFQATFKQGKVYEIINGEWFCYG